MPAFAIFLSTALLAGAATVDDTPAVDGLGQAVPGAALDAMRGGDSSVTVSVDNQGNVEGNTANGTFGAGNRVDGGAFGNAAGITTVIQNSGANVLIQNGTSVNVQFGGPGT